MLSFFPEYSIIDSVFSSRFLALYVFAVTIAVVTITYQVLYKHKKIDIREIDVIYACISLLYMLGLLKTDYRSSLFLLQYISQFVIYFCIRLNYDILKKIVLPNMFSIYAGLIIITHSFIAIEMHTKTKGGLAGIFKNSNYYACYIALLFIALVAILLYTKSGKKMLLWSYSISIIAFGNIIYTCSRTAMLGVIIACGILVVTKPSIWTKLKTYKSKNYILVISLGVLPVIGFLAWGAYCMKPVSFIGRILAWNITWNVIKMHPITGIGAGQLANLYNHFQANYFTMGLGSIPQRIAASEGRQVFNWYLEIFAEYGIIGGILFLLFWYYTIKKALKTLFEKSLMLLSESIIAKGCALVVVGFLIMSLTHFPQKIIPTFLLFNIALAFMVSYISENKEQISRTHMPHFIQIIIIAILVLATSIIIVKLPRYYSNFKAAAIWRQAKSLEKDYKSTEAVSLYKKVYPQLKWNSRFLYNYGNAQMSISNYNDAIIYYESGKKLLPFSSLYENLGMAYFMQASKTNNIEVTKEYYRRANINWQTAAEILPWRITPRYYLAYFNFKCANTNKAIKYARRIIEMPIKSYNLRSIEMKQEAKKYLLNYGYTNITVFTNVFNIHDRSTWNEGKW